MVTLKIFVTNAGGSPVQKPSLQSNFIPRAGEIIRLPPGHILKVVDVAYEVGPNGVTIQDVEVLVNQIQ